MGWASIARDIIWKPSNSFGSYSGRRKIRVGDGPSNIADLLEEEFDDQISEAAIWSLSQIWGENVRAHLENLLDAHEDDDQTAILEDALDNLVFTEDMTNLNLMALDADEPKEIDLEE